MDFFCARDEEVWIQTFKSLASKLRELFKVKDGGLKSGIFKAQDYGGLVPWEGLAFFPSQKMLNFILNFRAFGNVMLLIKISIVKQLGKSI